MQGISDIHTRRPHFTKIVVDVTGSKPIAVWSQSISGVSAINLLVAFYDINGRKREVLIFCFVPDTTRDGLNDFHYIVSSRIILLLRIYILQ
jgi:hypothetical protein